MNRAKITVVALVVCAVGHSTAGAEEFGFRSNEFCGSATANVFDGGPPLHESGCLSVPNQTFGVFAVSDFTQVGAAGATASASTQSTVFAFPEQLSVSVRLRAAYSPSFLAGGDNPGGEAAAELSSVIEFTMPVDQLDWEYNLRIVEDAPFFEGSTLVTVENVSQSQTLLTLTENTNVTFTTLQGAVGDLIRITSDISGAGSMGPGSDKDYRSRLTMLFTPEPSTGIVVMLGAMWSLRRRRSDPYGYA